jgi:hypothetical protein
MTTERTLIGANEFLFGKPVNLMKLVTSSILLAIILFTVFEYHAYLPPSSYPVPTIPGDYFVLAGILFYTIVVHIKPWGLLRFPRMNNIAFISGLTWEKRQQAATVYTKRKFFESLLFIAIFYTVRYGMIFYADHSPGLFSLLFPEIPSVLAFYCLYLFADKLVRCIPCSKREYMLSSEHVAHSSGILLKGNWRLRLAGILSSVAPKTLRIMSLRIILYIIRCDLFGFAFINTMAVIICGIIVFLLPSSVGLLVRMVLLTAPVVIFVEIRETIFTALQKTIDIPYWSFKPKTHMHTCMFNTSLLVIPYIVLFTVWQVRAGDGFFSQNSISYLLSIAAVIGSVSNMYVISAVSRKDQSGAYFAIAGSLLLCSMIPVAKVVFPVLVIIGSTVVFYKTIRNLQ